MNAFPIISHTTFHQRIQEKLQASIYFKVITAEQMETSAAAWYLLK